MTGPSHEAEVLARALYRRVLSGQPELAQVTFSSNVLQKYRGDRSFQITRTNTIATLRRAGAWKLDLGILPGDEAIHASLGDIIALPESERGHWLEHLLLPPLSGNFIRSRLHPGSCLDDGEVRPW